MLAWTDLVDIGNILNGHALIFQDNCPLNHPHGRLAGGERAKIESEWIKMEM